MIKNLIKQWLGISAHWDEYEAREELKEEIRDVVAEVLEQGFNAINYSTSDNAFSRSSNQTRLRYAIQTTVNNMAINVLDQCTIEAKSATNKIVKEHTEWVNSVEFANEVVAKLNKLQLER